MTRVLVVDDVEENRWLLRALLQGHGYEVEEAKDGLEALDLAWRRPPDLVVSDLLMPRMDGFTLLRHWKEDRRLRAAPFIVYTATYTDPADERLALDLGADAFVVKPAEPEPFLARIEELVARHGGPDAAAPRAQELIGFDKFDRYCRALQRKLDAKVAQLAEDRERLAAGLAIHQGVLEASRDAIFSLDRGYRYTSFNRAHAELMRAAYGAEIALGHTLPEYQHVGADWDMARRNLDRALAGEEFVDEAYSGEAGRVRACFEVTHNPIRAADGAVMGVAVHARDVTARRRSEEALRDSQERLRLAQKMEAVGRLAGGIAHDFNNLLTVILSSAGFALEATAPDSTVWADLHEIQGAASRAQALTRQLLAFSRRQVLQPRIIDVNDLVRNLERLLVRTLPEDVQLRTILGASPRLVLADSGQLEQVILNLVVNARDAMPAGGKLTIETSVAELDAAYAASHVSVVPGRYVQLSVTDTGVGMDAPTLARIFEPFFTTKELGKGTGLGLATAYGIVKQSGGYIWAYSEPGRGSCFKVYLPLAAGAQVAEVGKVEAASPPRAAGETVLVVEDDEAVRKTVVRTLERGGYRVLVATGPEEASALLQDHAGGLDLVLSDVVMPAGGGRVVAATVARRHPQARILFMSGFTDDTVVARGGIAPHAAFIQKPFSAHQLLDRIRRVLRGEA